MESRDNSYACAIAQVELIWDFRLSQGLTTKISVHLRFFFAVMPVPIA
ncbi:MAG: hypothetical protein J6M59_03215 [Bacteroidaceae bacterium]|nr:hypothetical protein [Bacteroidaceae bacterium]